MSVLDSQLAGESINVRERISDSWFCVSGMINALVKRKLLFIADLKSNHTAEFLVQDTSRKIKLNINDGFKYASHLGTPANLGLVSKEEKITIQVLYETMTMTLFIPAS